MKHKIQSTISPAALFNFNPKPSLAHLEMLAHASIDCTEDGENIFPRSSKQRYLLLGLPHAVPATRLLKKLMPPKPAVAPHLFKPMLPQPSKGGLKIVNDMLRPQLVLLRCEPPK